MVGRATAGPVDVAVDAFKERIDRLLAQQGDVDFLRGAYQLALGRGIDANGERFYIQRLQGGTPRLDIVWELAISNEGRRHLAAEPALWQAVGRIAGRHPSPERSVDGLLGLPDDQFLEACIEFFSRDETHGHVRQLALAALDGGQPRDQVLLSLALASGRSAFPEVEGLDAFIARSQEGLFPVAASVQELLAYEDHAFIDCAYKTLLGRAPDAAGGSHYLGRLLAGYSRTSVIAALARSDEARHHPAAPAGLQSACRRYRLANGLLRVRWAAWLLNTESDQSDLRQRRRVDVLARRLGALEARLISGTASASNDSPPDRRADFDHEALIDVQRHNFERETTALRKLAAQLVDSLERSGSRGDHAEPGRRRRRPVRR